jgi:hypothetical protein
MLLVLLLCGAPKAGVLQPVHTIHTQCAFNVPTLTARRLHVTTTLETLAAKSGTLLGEKLSGNLAESSEFHATLGIFYMPQIYDMGPTALLPFRMKDFFRPEKSDDFGRV